MGARDIRRTARRLENAKLAMRAPWNMCVVIRYVASKKALSGSWLPADGSVKNTTSVSSARRA